MAITFTRTPGPLVPDVEFICRQDAGNEHYKNAVEITGTEEDKVHGQSQNRYSLHPSHSVNTEMLAESAKSRNNALCGE